MARSNTTIQNKATSSLVPKDQKRTKWKDYIGSYAFLAPALSFLLAFIVFPIFYLVYLSFQEYQLPNPAHWNGVENYVKLFQDKLFFKSLLNTSIYTLGSMTIGIMAALFMAVLLNRQLKGIRFFKVFYFLPTITSEVITAMIFLWIFDNNLGILNYFLKTWGLESPPAWLLDPFWAMTILILVGAWRGASYNTPIFLAALQGVPKSLYEAADLDGASGWKKFWHISIPSILPIVVYSVVMSIIGSFQVVAIVDVLTNGGPQNSTLVAIKHIWQQAFEFNHVGYGATLSLFLFPILFIITWLQLRLSAGRN